MLARLGTENDLEREGYLFEPKLDGFRAICYKGPELEFYNRKQQKITHRFPELTFASQLKCDECILDGELVAYNQQGNPDFRLLMKRRMKVIERTGRAAVPAMYAAFDICMKDGKNLMSLPLKERKQILDETVDEGPKIQKVFTTTDGKKLYEMMLQRKLEGVVAKDLNSPYLAGRRTDNWIKIKTFKTLDAIIVGYSSEKRKVSSVYVAAYVEGTSRLRFLGGVGTGFTDAFIRELHGMLKPIETDTPPVKDVPKGYGQSIWVKPELACEIKYLEFDSKGMMRNPVFLRLREDKPLEECVVEKEAL